MLNSPFFVVICLLNSVSSPEPIASFYESNESGNLLTVHLPHGELHSEFSRRLIIVFVPLLHSSFLIIPAAPNGNAHMMSSWILSASTGVTIVQSQI